MNAREPVSALNECARACLWIYVAAPAMTAPRDVQCSSSTNVLNRDILGVVLQARSPVHRFTFFFLLPIP